MNTCLQVTLQLISKCYIVYYAEAYDSLSNPPQVIVELHANTEFTNQRDEHLGLDHTSVVFHEAAILNGSEWKLLHVIRMIN